MTVLQCRTHGRAFTLYPLGHLPYGRLAVAPVGLDGELLRSTEGEQVGGKRQPAWSTTLFASAFAAIHAPTIKLTDPRWWATEAPERLAQGAAILGVHPELSVQAADAIAFRLEIPRLVLRQAAGAYERARGRAARGRVLVGVLGELGDTCLLDRVLAAGACAGCWGTVTRWDGASRGARGRVPGARRRRRVSGRNRRRRYEFPIVRPGLGAAQIALAETRTAHGRQEIAAHAACYVARPEAVKPMARCTVGRS